MKKRLISLVLVFCTLLSLLPISAMAAPAETETSSNNPFTDVKESAWYYDAVMYAYANGLVNGVTSTTFDPQGGMTRGMFVTVLGRMAGVDVKAYQGRSTFDDVDANVYYAPYVAWGYKHGIINGTGKNQFSPNMLINRQQLATFFVRYCEVFDVEYGTDTTVSTQPADIDEVADWAKDSVLKLWSKGILNGDGTNFNPTDEATRAEAVTLSTRMDYAVETWYSEPGVESERVRIDPATGEALKPEEDQKEEDKKEEDQKEEEQKPSSGNSGWNDDYNYTTYYEVQFAMGTGQDGTGVTLPQTKTYEAGTKITLLPVPHKQNGMFLGWYYDATLENAVGENDTVNRNMTLYAKMGEVTPVSEQETPNYITVVVPANQVASYSFDIKDYTADSVEYFNHVSSLNADMTYTVNGTKVNAAYEQGQTYSVKLLDDSAAVFVVNGTEQPSTIRVLNIITEKAEVQNLVLDGSVKYLPYTSVTNMTGTALDGLFTASITTQETGTIQQNKNVGTFTYTGSGLVVGDTVAIYEGTQPNLRTDASVNEAVAYVKITAIDGTTYSYETAESEEVLFTPDVLPISASADTDGDADNNSITVAADVLDFTDDKYAEMGLDSQTVVEAGDFIAFYTGSDVATGTSAGFGKIISVTEADGNFVITYTAASQDEVLAAMDLYSTRNEEIELTEEEKAQIESDMVAQAIESGFVDEAAEYLTALAIETDGFRELSDDLDMDLSSYSITFADGSPVDSETMDLMAVKAEITKKDISANVMAGTLTHFEDGTGLRAELVMTFTVEIGSGDNKLEITLEAIFEQEVMLTINVSGGAIWKWKWIFPYIYDYQMNANIDVGTYTGIGITATAKTVGKEDEDEGFDWNMSTGNKAGDKIISIGKQIKDLMDQKEEFMGQFTVPTVGLDGEEVESAGTLTNGGLAEKYADMMENAEESWIDILRVELFSSEGCVDRLHILCYGIGADFVVSANLYVTMGMTFEYAVAKRYNFSLQLFHKKSTNETIDLEEAHYQFDFYVMGTAGIRAGIEFELAIGLFSLKLDSIGICAETGAYARLWGYFYYSLSWTESEGKSSTCSGALLIEIGLYLEITFKAQLFSSDKLTYQPTLYENEWPLLTIGEAENVYDFAYEDDDEMLAMEITGAKQFTLSSDLFAMNYLDLKSGDLYGTDADDEDEDGEPDNPAGSFDDATESHYTITLSNPKFTYDPDGNIVTVAPDGSTGETCEITITWKHGTLAFSARPIERTVTIEWSDPENARFIAFDSKGGSAVNMIVGGVGASINAPAAPTKIGYTFAGWYEDADCTRAFSFPSTLPDYLEQTGTEKGITVYAKWTPNTDTKYTVEHYLEELNGKYVLYAEANPEDRGWNYADGDDPTVQTKTGTTDADTAATVLSPIPTGFVAPTEAEVAAAQQIIAPDGSSVVKLYYKRAEYTTTFDYGTVGGDTEPLVYKTKYYGTVVVPAMVLGGYDFKDFGNELKDSEGKLVKSIRVTGNETYTAEWDARTDTPYRAELYVEKTDGSGYVLAADPNAIQHLGGTTGAAVDLTSDAIAKLADTTGLTYSGATVNGVAVSESNPAIVTTDGKLVIKLLYNRVQNVVTFNSNGGSAVDALENVRYGAKLNVPEATTKEGWTFDGWYTTDDFAEGTKVDFSTYTMPASDVTLYAKWNAGERSYTVNHYVQGVDGQYSIADTASNQPTTTGAELTLSELVNSDLLRENIITYKEAKVGDNVVTTYVIPATGDVVINLYYQRAQYTLTWELNDGVAGEAPYTAAGLVYAEAPIIVPTLTKQGYTYTWSPEVPATMPAAVATYTAVWTAGTDTAYTVKHLKQNADNDEYTEVLVEPKTGTTGELTAAVAQDYSADGFQAGVFTDTAIAADGSTVVEIKYDRETYEVTFDANGGTLKDDAAKTFRHGQTFSVTAPEREDYAFAGWFEGETKFEAAVVTKTMALTAHWTAGAVNYTVNHYVMGTDGTYPATAIFTETGNGIVGSTVALSTLKKSDYEYENGAGTAYDTTKTEENGATVTVSKGMTVNIYYVRKAYSLTWDANGGEMAGGTSGTVYYGADITAPTVTKTGHTGGWSSVAATMPAADTTYTAQWTVNQYTITFNTDGGSVIAPITQDYNSDVTAPANPTKTGYDFVKWVDENGTDASVPVKMPAGDMTLKAIWEAQTYAIEYDLDGGSITGQPTTHTYGQTTRIPNPTRTGYTFGGWTVNGGTGKVENLILGATDYTVAITLTANWTVKQYTITFEENGGTQVADITQDYGTDVGTVTEPTKEGYTFAGWTVDVPATMPAENMTITATWTPVEYTITYNLNGGSYTPALTKYTIETESQSFGAPTRANYTFLGWYTSLAFEESTKVTGITKGQTGDVTVYAKWTEAAYTIDYVMNDSEDDRAENLNPSSALITKPELTLQDPTRTQYDFTGWTATGGFTCNSETLSKDLGNAGTITLTGNTTFTAHWRGKPVTVVLDANYNSETLDPITVYYTEKYGTLPTPTRIGYTFVSWNTNYGINNNWGDEVNADTTVTQTDTHTLYAKWTPNRYKITYEMNGGTNNSTNTIHTYGTPTKIAKPEKIGYTFLGWTINGTGDPLEATDGTLTLGPTDYTDDITLTANWTPETYTVSFNLNDGDGTAPGNISVTYDGIYGELPTPIRTGYDFKGWFTAASGGEKVENTTKVTITVNQTLYAQWGAKAILVMCDPNGGNFEGSTNPQGTYCFYDGTYAGLFGFLDPLTREDYSFIGWNTMANGTGEWISAETQIKNAEQHTLYAQWGYAIKVNDVQVTPGNSGNVLGDGTVRYDHETKTLTLSGATISGSIAGEGVIHSDLSSALTINLTGANSITNTATANSYGIIAGSNLTITGTSGSSLTVTANGTAIEITGSNDLYIKGGCTVTADGGKTGSTANVGIVSFHIFVERGTLIAKGGKQAVDTKAIGYTAVYDSAKVEIYNDYEGERYANELDGVSYIADIVKSQCIKVVKS